MRNILRGLLSARRSTRWGGDVRRVRTGAVLAVVAVLATVVPLTVGSGDASAVGLGAAYLDLGVRNIQYGTSPAAAAYLGAYGLNVGTPLQLDAFCVEHAGSAPNPAPGAYHVVSKPGVENDPILAPAVNYFQWIRLFETDPNQRAIQGAAVAAVAHYRAAQISLPGETAYPAGVGNPTGPGSFLTSNAGTVRTVVGDSNVGTTNAAAVANAAWIMWNAFQVAPGPYSASTSIVSGHPGNTSGWVTAAVSLSASNGNRAAGFTLSQSSFGVDNGNTLQFSYDPAFGTIIPAGDALAFTPSGAGAGYVYARWHVTNPLASTGILGSVRTLSNTITYMEPNNPAEQNVVVAGQLQDLVTGASSAAPPAPQVRIAKFNDNAAYQGVAGLVFHVHLDANTNGVVDGGDSEVATLTTDTNGNAVSGGLAGLVGSQVIITEDAAVANSLGMNAAGPWVIASLNPADTNAITANNSVYTTGSLSLNKLDATTSAPLAGATLRVERDNDNNGSFETAVGTFTSAVTPVTVAGLKAGTYQVTELTPPPGYTLPQVQSQVVTLTAGGSNTVTFRDVVPELTSDVFAQTPTAAPPILPPTGPIPMASVDPLTVAAGDDVGDSATVTGPATSTPGLVTFELYGPFPDRTDVVCTGTPIFTTTETITGPGTVRTTDLYTPTSAGLYTWVASWEGADGSTATHDCGIASESFIVNPTLATKAKSTSVAPGGTASDIAILSGTYAGQTGTITLDTYGPFPSTTIAATACTPATLVPVTTQISYKVTATGATGEFESPQIALPSAGVYTFVETWHGDDGTTATHPCGQSTETFTVHPKLATKVKASSIVAGDPASDVAILSGTYAGQTGTITAVAYGPFPSKTIAADACVESKVAGKVSYKVTATGATGEFESPAVTVASSGVYTFVETWVGDDGSTATHTCGDAAETFTVNPKLATKAAAAEIKRGGANSDIAILSGTYAGQTGTITAVAYGPFPSAEIAADACTTEKVAGTVSYNVTATGDTGEFASPELTFDTAGYFTFVETWTGDDGSTATHTCGDAAETFLVKAPADALSQTLAVTGANSGSLLWVGVALAGLGVALVGAARKRRRVV